MEIGAISTVNAAQLLRRGGKIGLWLLLICIAYALAQLVWQLNRSTPASAPASEVKQTTSHKPFEEGLMQFAEAPIPAADAKPGLILAGVLTVGAAHGSALIVNGGGEEKTFFVGDTVYGGAKLKAVYADRVLLEGERGLTTLKLRSEVRIGNVPVQQPGSEASSLSDVAGAEYFVPSMSSTGELIGYRLSPSVREPMLQRWGLQPDDVITAIHGLSMLQSDNRARALLRFQSHEFASITIIRDGNKLINITMMNAEEPKASE